MNHSSEFPRLSAIVDSSDDAIISKDFFGIINTWNNAATRIFGFTPEEAIGKHISIIIPEEYIAEENNFIDEIKNGSHIKSYETVRRKKDGSTFPASITVSPIKNSVAYIIGVSIIARDISDRQIGDRNKSLLASIIDSSADAIISKNLNGIITSWNKGAEKIFGYSEKEAVGQSISIIIPKNKYEEEANIISKIISGEKVDPIETIRKRKDGTEITVSVAISPIKDRNNKITGASKIARDITQKAELEKERELFTQKLQKLNKYKDDFMMMASHELKTPLTIIKTNLQILHELVAENICDIRFVDKAIHNVDNLSNLISELLDVSKIQNGKLDLHITSFDLMELLHEIIGVMQHAAPNSEIILKRPTTVIEIMADRDRIREVVQNMLDNAIKYSPDGKKINVETSVKNGGVIVKVTDHGIGIPKEDIEKIFTRFYRVGGVASTYPGVGIGLYISSEIVRHHGGKMWAESQLNKGSVFYVEIPKQIPDALNMAS